MTALLRWPLPADDAPEFVAPFATGDRIVEHDRITAGPLRVMGCEWTCGHWRVEAAHGHLYSSAPADHFVRVPADWTEPPEPPWSARAMLECATDGALTQEQYAEARRADDARLRERVDWLLSLADWWLFVGALVRPDIADHEARGLRDLAADLLREVGS